VNKVNVYKSVTFTTYPHEGKEPGERGERCAEFFWFAAHAACQTEEPPLHQENSGSMGELGKLYSAESAIRKLGIASR